jgi:hypothetical protein
MLHLAHSSRENSTEFRRIAECHAIPTIRAKLIASRVKPRFTLLAEERGGNMSRNAWQTPFGKLLIGSSILAALAGFVLVKAVKDSGTAPQDVISANGEAYENEAEQLTLPDANPPDAAPVEQEAEITMEPDTSQYASQEQPADESPAEVTGDAEGAQE